MLLSYEAADYQQRHNPHLSHKIRPAGFRIAFRGHVVYQPIKTPAEGFQGVAHTCSEHKVDVFRTLFGCQVGFSRSLRENREGMIFLLYSSL